MSDEIPAGVSQLLSEHDRMRASLQGPGRGYRPDTVPVSQILHPASLKEHGINGTNIGDLVAGLNARNSAGLKAWYEDNMPLVQGLTPIEQGALIVAKELFAKP